MNHPELEKWVSFTLGEMHPEERRGLNQHLEACPQCREIVETWKRSMNRLDAWKLPRKRRRAPAFLPMLQWASAAAVLLCAGIAIGRLNAPKLDVKAVQAALEIRLQQAEMRADHKLDETVATLTKALERRRGEDNKAILAAFDKLESQHTADILALKRDVDTVALNADAGLQQTEQQLVQLADFKPAASRP